MGYRPAGSAPTIAALILDSRLQPFYRRTIQRHGIGQLCGDKSELSACLQDNPGIQAVIVSACDDTGRSSAALVGFLGRRHPTVPVIALASLAADNVKALVASARAGLSDVVLVDHDDALVVLRNCIQRSGATTAYRLPAELRASVPQRVHAEVAACLAAGTSRVGVEDVARSMAITRRTLALRLSRAHLLPAGELISWGRVLAAAAELAESVRSVESVALALSFGSASGLHNIVRRYTGLTPSQLRHAGGPALVLRSLERALDARRAADRTAPCNTCELELPLG